MVNPEYAERLVTLEKKVEVLARELESLRKENAMLRAAAQRVGLSHDAKAFEKEGEIAVAN